MDWTVPAISSPELWALPDICGIFLGCSSIPYIHCLVDMLVILPVLWIHPADHNLDQDFIGARLRDWRVNDLDARAGGDYCFFHIEYCGMIELSLRGVSKQVSER